MIPMTGARLRAQELAAIRSNDPRRYNASYGRAIRSGSGVLGPDTISDAFSPRNAPLLARLRAEAFGSRSLRGT